MMVLRKYSQNLLTQQGKRFGAVILIYLMMNVIHISAMENNGRGAKAIGMANTFVAVSDNPWAIDYNPAGLIQISNIQWSAFLVPEQFGFSELKTAAFAAVIPFSYSTIGFMVENFGFDLYREIDFSTASAIKFDTSVSAGLCLNYHHLTISHYGISNKIILKGGILVHATESVAVGFSFSNITGTAIGKQDEKIPQVCELGTCWLPLHNLQLSVEMEKDVRYSASLKAGVEQIIFDMIALRAGVANNPDKFAAGFAVKYSLFEFAYAGYSQPALGWTHQIELSFKLDQ